jgi:thiamine pyrophosphate-dependent acetolactate synthase large subunit-like protein
VHGCGSSTTPDGAIRCGTARPAGGLKPHAVVERLALLAAEREDVIWTTGVGQHQMWAMQYLPIDRPRSFITSGGHGTMGFGLPAAIGARTARPDASVVCVDGATGLAMAFKTRDERRCALSFFGDARRHAAIGMRR